MTRDPMLEALWRAPVLEELSRADLDLVVGTMRRVTLGRGERLFEQGAPGASMYVLGTGRLAVLVRDGRGRENRISELRPGDCVGEMSFLDPQPRSAGVAAEEPSTVLELDRHLLAYLRQDAPRAAAAIVGGVIRQLCTRLRATNQLIEAQLQRVGAGRDAAGPEPPPEERGPAPQPHRDPLELERVELLRGLTGADRAALTRVAPPMRYEDRALLCREGEPGASCFLLLHGQVDVLRLLRGKRRRLATLPAGALVGQLALVEQAPRTASVRARGQVLCMELHNADFARLLAAKSPLALRFQEQIAVSGIRQLRMANERCVEIFDRAKSAWGQAPAAPARAPQGQAPGRAPEAPPRHPVEIGDPLAFIQTALREWGMSMADLDRMDVVKTDGIMDGAELAARKRRG